MTSFPYETTPLLGQDTPIGLAVIEAYGQNHDVWLPFDMIVDTGAAISIMPASVAGLLGLNLTSGQALPLLGVGGGGLQTYVHTVTVRFRGETQAFPLQIAFAATDDVPLLLGRYGLWNQVSRIVFDNKTRTVTFGETTPTPPPSPRTPYVLIGALALAAAIWWLT